MCQMDSDTQDDPNLCWPTRGCLPSDPHNLLTAALVKQVLSHQKYVWQIVQQGQKVSFQSPSPGQRCSKAMMKTQLQMSWTYQLTCECDLGWGSRVHGLADGGFRLCLRKKPPKELTAFLRASQEKAQVSKEKLLCHLCARLVSRLISETGLLCTPLQSKRCSLSHFKDK